MKGRKQNFFLLSPASFILLMRFNTGLRTGDGSTSGFGGVGMVSVLIDFKNRKM